MKAVAWIEDLDKAVAEARNLNKPLFLDFFNPG
jgi:hypothetical protein